MMPLSQVLAYNVEHLEEAAEHWNKVADHRESTFAEVRNRAHSITWEGLSADAMHEHVGRDLQKAVFTADDLRGAAMMARTGASDLYSMHSRLLYNLEDVTAAGFSVAEDYTATDIRPSNSAIEKFARQQEAIDHSADLKLKATELTGADARVGAQLQTATAGEGKVQFTDFNPYDGPIPEPPSPAPPGKAWNYFHDDMGGGSWSLQDALKPCAPSDEFWDVAGAAGAIGGGVIAGPPGIIPGLATAGAPINDLFKCEAP